MSDKPVIPSDLVSTLSDLGSVFRRERKARKLTQSDVAKRAGCRRQTIVDMEAGKNIGTLTLLNAVAALGLTLGLNPHRTLVGEELKAMLGPDWEDD